MNKRGFLKKRQAENLQKFAHGSLTAELLAHDGNEHINADGNPDLGLHRVFGVAIETFDVEVLFDPFEEEFDTPAGTIELSDGKRG